MAGNSTQSAHGPGRPFQKGQSGNPKGRPKQTPEERDALQLIRSLAPEAAERLAEIIRDPSVKVEAQLKAIEIIFERSYGKAYATEQTNTAPVTIVWQR